MNSKATLDISARIEGYQSSLQQFKRAIDQLDVGSQVKKSLERAFTAAQEYVDKLAKTPIVNVQTQSQINKLKNNLEQASSLMHNIATQFNGITGADLNLSNIDASFNETTAKIVQLKNELSSLDTPKLQAFVGKVSGIKKAFTDMGEDISTLNVQQGLERLSAGLEAAKRRSEDLQKELQRVGEQYQRQVQAASQYSQLSDYSRIPFLSAAGLNGDNSLKVENINFNTDNFSQQAISAFREQIFAQLRASLNNNQDFSQDINTILNNIFNNAFGQGVNLSNLTGALNIFVKQISEQLSEKFSQLGQKSGIYSALFGGDVRTQAGALSRISELLKIITLSGSQAGQALSGVTERLFNLQAISGKDKDAIIKLIDNGQFEQAQQKLRGIVEGLERTRDVSEEEKKKLLEQAEALEQAIKLEQDRQKLYAQVSRNIVKKDEYKGWIEQVEELRQRITQLEALLNVPKDRYVDNIRRSVAETDQFAQSLQLTSQQVERLNNTVQGLKAQQQLIGKVKGLLTRWFSIYAVVNKVTQAIRTMISTVAQLDKTITNIAIVTDMSQNDLWQAMPTYTKTAREFAASISGVYEVSQLYYQQGELNI